MLGAADVHARTEAAILAALPSWRASAHAWEDLALVPDGAERSHLSFVVATPDTRWLEGRQVRAVGTLQYCETTVAVRWLYRLRVEARASDYRLALAEEAALVRAVIGASETPELRLVLTDGARRRELAASSGPYLLCDLTFLAHHTVSLA